MSDWGRGTYGQGGSALASIGDWFTDKRDREERRRAETTAQQQRDEMIRKQMLMTMMQNPNAYNRELLRQQGIEVPEVPVPELTEQEKFNRRIYSGLNAQDPNAPLSIDPLAMGIVDPRLAGAAPWMGQAGQRFNYANAGALPEGVITAQKVEDKVAPSWKENQDQENWSKEFLTLKKPKSAAEIGLINAQTGHVGAQTGHVKEQTKNVVLSRDPTSPVSPGFVKPAPAKQASNTVASPESFAAEGVAAIDDFLSDPGFEAAVGAKNVFSQPPWRDKPIAGTDAAGAVAKYDRIKSLLTIPNLGIMKGVLSDSDIRMLSGLAAANIIDMKEGPARDELLRAREVLLKKIGAASSTSGATIRYDSKGNRIP